MGETPYFLDERGLRHRPAPRRVSALPDAAMITGAVYLAARQEKLLPFGHCALPDSNSYYTLYPAISQAFSGTLHRINEDIDAWHKEYIAAARLFIQAVQDRATQDVQLASKETELQLTKLAEQIADNDTTVRLEVAARLACEASGVVRAMSEFESMLKLSRNPRIYRSGMNLHKPSFRKILAAEVVKSDEPLLLVIFSHPAGLDLVLAYAKQGKTGQALVLEAIAIAMRAARDAFAEMLSQPLRIWRYPPILYFALYGLKIDDVDGIHGYARQIGQALTKEPLDDLLSLAQVTLTGIALLFSGPGGLAVVATAELAGTAVSAVQVGRDYLRERENEFLTEANAFGLVNGGPPAMTNRPVNFSGVAIDGALGLLGGLALVPHFQAKLRPQSIQPRTVTSSSLVSTGPSKPPRDLSMPRSIQTGEHFPLGDLGKNVTYAQAPWSPSVRSSKRGGLPKPMTDSLNDVPAPKNQPSPTRSPGNSSREAAIASNIDARGLPERTAAPNASAASAAPASPTISERLGEPVKNGVGPQPGPIGYGTMKKPREPLPPDHPKARKPIVSGFNEYDLSELEYRYIREYGHPYGPYVNAIMPDGSLDPAFKGVFISSMNSPEAGHVISISELLDNPKFRALPTRMQIEIAWHPSNIRADSKTFNGALQDTPIAEFSGNSTRGLSVDPAFRVQRIADEKKTRAYMNFMIDQEYKKIQAAAESALRKSGMDPNRMTSITEATPSRVPATAPTSEERMVPGAFPYEKLKSAKSWAQRTGNDLKRMVPVPQANEPVEITKPRGKKGP